MEIESLLNLYRNKTIAGDDYAPLKKVIAEMMPRGYELSEDEYGNQYWTYPESESEYILSAHLDSVECNGKATLFTIKKGVITGRTAGGIKTNLGADDLNGVFIAIEVARRIDVAQKPAIVFFLDEEVGRVGSSNLDEKFFAGYTGCIVIDRAGMNHIIGKDSHGITSTLLAVQFKSNVNKFRYEIGMSSDANMTGCVIDSINISCGSYGQHSESERTIISDVEYIIDNVLAFLLSDKSYYASDVAEYHRFLTARKLEKKPKYERINYEKRWTTYDDYWLYDYYLSKRGGYESQKAPQPVRWIDGGVSEDGADFFQEDWEF